MCSVLQALRLSVHSLTERSCTCRADSGEQVLFRELDRIQQGMYNKFGKRNRSTLQLEEGAWKEAKATYDQKTLTCLWGVISDLFLGEQKPDCSDMKSELKSEEN